MYRLFKSQFSAIEFEDEDEFEYEDDFQEFKDKGRV
jgi:hypothetical protein